MLKSTESQPKVLWPSAAVPAYRAAVTVKKTPSNIWLVWANVMHIANCCSVLSAMYSTSTKYVYMTQCTAMFIAEKKTDGPERETYWCQLHTSTLVWCQTCSKLRGRRWLARKAVSR